MVSGKIQGLPFSSPAKVIDTSDSADEVEGFGEVLGVAVDPLALVTALGDGVELLGAEVTLGSHESVKACRWPNVGGRRFNDLADVAG